MAIEGPLRELGIHDVFQLLDLSRKTGTLRVYSPERNNEGSVYFDAGTIVAATMKSNPHLLGTILERSGKATPADLARATAMQRAGDKRRVGEILVAHGIVTPRDIDRFMRLQIETVVFDLMSWSEGFFSFTEEPPRPIRKDIAVRVSTESLLMEVLCASHRTAECMELARQGTVQSELPILVLSSEPAGVHLFVQEVTGRQRDESPIPMVIIGLERSGGCCQYWKDSTP